MAAHLYSGVRSLHLLLDTPYDLIRTDDIRDDIAGIKVWYSTTSGFNPDIGEGILAFDGLSLSITISDLSPSTRYYIKYAFISNIDPTTYSISSELSEIVYDQATRIYGYLTNDPVGITTNNDGTGGDFSIATGTFKVFDLNTDVTGLGVSYSIKLNSNYHIIDAHIDPITGEYSCSSMDANTGSVTFLAQYDGVTVEQVWNVYKAIAGETAPLIQLSATNTSFVYSSARATTSTTLSSIISATLKNISGIPVFTATGYTRDGILLGNVSFTQNDNEITITRNDFGALGTTLGYVIIIAQIGSVSDSFTLYRINDGTDQITVELSNTAHTIPAANNGDTVPANYLGSGTTIKVKQGNLYLPVDQTSPLTTPGTWNITEINAVGITPDPTPTISGNYIDFDSHAAMTQDQAYIDYVVYYITAGGDDGYITVRQSFSKSKEGIAGASSPSVTITAPRLAFVTPKNTGTVTPVTITLTATISNIPNPQYEWYIDDVLQPNSNTSTFIADSFIDVLSKSYKVQVTDINEQISVYDSFSLYHIAEGSDSLAVGLSNENQTISCDSTGTPITGQFPITIDSVVVRGTQVLTSPEVVYDKVPNSEFGMTSTINSSGTITITEISSLFAECIYSFTIGGVTLYKTVTLNKSIDGASAPIVTLTADPVQIFVKLKNSTTVYPATTRIKSQIINIVNPIYSWFINGVLDSNIGSYLDIESFTGDPKLVKVIVNGDNGKTAYDELTVYSINEGDDTLQAGITNESRQLLSNSSGIIYGGQLPLNSQMGVVRGAEIITTGYGVVYSVTNSTISGLTASIDSSTGVITISGSSMDSDTVEFEFNADINGTILTKILTISKTKDGAEGPQGEPGIDGTDGTNGTRTAILDMYKWSESIPTTFPVGTSTYTWYTGALIKTLDAPATYSTTSGDQFGISVGISDTYTIVGANQEDDVGGTQSGAAYIYNTTTGELLFVLKNPNAYSTSASDYFGQSVGISPNGTYAIVGAYAEDDTGGTTSGVAYIYNLSNLTPGAAPVTITTADYILKNPTVFSTSSGDSFGYSVAISNQYAIVGAYGEDSGGSLSGAAYIYDLSTLQPGTVLTATYALTNPNVYSTGSNDYFGISVDISDTYAIVGAYLEDAAIGLGSGAAYIYTLSTLTGPTVSSANYSLTNPSAYGTGTNDYFGFSVGISDTHAIVGAYLEDDSFYTDSGKAYIYDIATLSPGIVSQATITISDPNPYSTSSADQFGYKVAISDTYAAISAPQEDDSGGASSGKAYVYDFTTGSLLWTMNNPNPYSTAGSDQFGLSIDISSNYVIGGAANEDDPGGSSAGKAYIFNANLSPYGQFTAPITTNGWSLTPPPPVAGQTLYIARTLYSDPYTTQTSEVTWNTQAAIPLSSSGNNGTRTAILELYRWSASAPTTFPSGTSTYTWSTGAFTLPATTNSWSLLPGSPIAGYTLWGCSVTYVDTDTTTTSPVTWNTSTAYAVGAAGSDSTVPGPTGPRSATVYFYYQVAQGTLPTAPTTAQVSYNFSTSTATITATNWSNTFSPGVISNQVGSNNKYWTCRVIFQEQTYGGIINETIIGPYSWLNFDGLVTFTNLANGTNQAGLDATYIDGGTITTGSIVVDRLTSGATSTIGTTGQFGLGDIVTPVIGGAKATVYGKNATQEQWGGAFVNTSTTAVAVPGSSPTQYYYFNGLLGATANPYGVGLGAYNQASSSPLSMRSAMIAGQHDVSAYGVLFKKNSYSVSGGNFGSNTGLYRSAQWLLGVVDRAAVFEYMGDSSINSTYNRTDGNFDHQVILGFSHNGSQFSQINPTPATTTRSKVWIGGTTRAYAIEVEAGNTVTGAKIPGGVSLFTGVHEGLSYSEFDIGDIVVDSQLVVKQDISNTTFIQELSSQINQRGVIGIVAKTRPLSEELTIEQQAIDRYNSNNSTSTGNIVTGYANFDPIVEEPKTPYTNLNTDATHILYINALGEGQINVCGENGNIERGDLIVTSSIPGKGMKQSDDIIRSYTVAKARESVTFSNSTEIKMIACIYLCG